MQLLSLSFSHAPAHHNCGHGTGPFLWFAGDAIDGSLGRDELGRLPQQPQDWRLPLPRWIELKAQRKVRRGTVETKRGGVYELHRSPCRWSSAGQGRRSWLWETPRPRWRWGWVRIMFIPIGILLAALQTDFGVQVRSIADIRCLPLCLHSGRSGEDIVR